jgi:hypothetical protein
VEGLLFCQCNKNKRTRLVLGAVNLERYIGLIRGYIFYFIFYLSHEHEYVFFQQDRVTIYRNDNEMASVLNVFVGLLVHQI